MPEHTPDRDRVSSHSDADGIEIVRTFDAPRELVFEAWTRAEAWAAWFGEPGSSIKPDRISMDARPGGRWSLVMIYGPEEVELPFSGEFREVVEPQRIVLTLTDAEHPDGARVARLPGAPERLPQDATRRAVERRLDRVDRIVRGASFAIPNGRPSDRGHANRCSVRSDP